MPSDKTKRIRMPELTVVVPTFNEADNLAAVVAEVERALSGVDWELLFVDDDSPDGTSERARALAQTDPRVRCVQRIGRRGWPVPVSRVCWHRRRRTWL